MEWSNLGKKTYDMLWPPVSSDISVARKAAYNGFIAAALCSVATGIFAAFGIFGFSKFALIDSFMFALIAWGILKMSRIAATAGLILYVFERMDAWINAGRLSDTFVIAILFILFFIGGIRGTFAYHRFKK